ncbi:MAG: hypothetical protein JRD89_21370 [Deltaproteobacteria bacterium]|nr:hypothetical protein [Deltaproteobacteria bacterium]
MKIKKIFDWSPFKTKKDALKMAEIARKDGFKIRIVPAPLRIRPLGFKWQTVVVGRRKASRKRRKR